MITKGSTLINQQNGELAFKIFPFENDHHFDHVQRHNYYSIIIIYAGSFEVQIELTKYELNHKTIICTSPYQPYSITSPDPIKGVVLNFHSDFFCTYKHHNEIQTEGVLFHNVFQPSFFKFENEEPLLNILELMTNEITHENIGQHQQLVSYLKIFLVSIIRVKKAHSENLPINSKGKPSLIDDLVYNIESNYRLKHSSQEYATMLNVSTSALGKMVKKHFGKTLTSLITERIMIEAKRELYLTSKTVKEIAHLLGYQDEYYFSRVFKKQTGISPTLYRSTVGFAKLEQL